MRMQSVFTKLSLLSVFVFFTFTLIADDIAVTKGGKVLMPFVVSNKELNSFQHTPYKHQIFKDAFADIKKQLRKATGADFDQPAQNISGYIKIGDAALTTPKLKAEAAALSPGAYILRKSGNDILIFGRDTIADINAMYGFLYHCAGIEFMGESELFFVIPKGDLLVPDDLNMKITPSFLTRFHSGARKPQAPGFMYGVRTGNFFNNSEYNYHPIHSYYRIMHPRIYRKDHPEYYALWQGERENPGPKDHAWQLCLTNENLIKELIKNAEKFFSDKSHVLFDIVPSDSGRYCQCEKCANVRKGKSETDVLLYAVNRVAKALAVKYPDQWVGILAYGVTSKPPKCEIESNVLIGYAPDISQWYDAKLKAEELENIEEWRAKIKHSSRPAYSAWHPYESDGGPWPRYFPRHYASAMKLMHDKYNVISYSGDTLTGFWPFTGPQNYLISRLLWDINLDPENVLNHYFDTMFGPATKAMRNFYEHLETCYMRPREGGKWLKDWGWHIDPLYIYTQEDVTFLRASLGVAKQAAKNSPVALARINYISEKAAPSLNMMETYNLSKNFDNKKKLPEIKDVERCLDVIATTEDDWKRVVMSDPTLCRYTDPAKDVKCARTAWRMLVEAKLAPVIARLMKARPDDPEVKKLYNKFASNDISRLKIDNELGKVKRGKNLIPNSGFEVNGNMAPVGPEWRKTGLAHWAYWTATPSDRLGISTKVRHSGTQSAFLDSTDNSECFISVFPLSSSDKKRFYYVSGWIYRTDPDATVKMSIAWHDKKGRAYYMPRYEIAAKECDQWEKLELIVEAPEKAVRGQFQFDTKSKKGCPTYFDDALVCNITEIK